MTSHLRGTLGMLDHDHISESVVTLCDGVAGAPIEREPTWNEMRAAWLNGTQQNMPSWLPGVCALTAARIEMRAQAREQAREGVLPQTAPAGRTLRRRGLFGGAR